MRHYQRGSVARRPRARARLCRDRSSRAASRAAERGRHHRSVAGRVQISVQGPRGSGSGVQACSMPVACRGLSRRVHAVLHDRVALGTIADMVPLVGENRALVWWGLSVLNHSSRPGLQVLIARSGLHAGSITAADVGYKLCPRLNAAGRIGNDSAAYALLTARSYEEAESYATILEQRNRERQHLTQEAYEACHEVCAAHPSVPPIGLSSRT